ncbi:peptidyl-prolyl cis-trans isomerase-like 4 isoform X2 [Sitophilus oryzae]|uniref:Peptidyl-prolyl cis-trans isomerase n=1 Tax=Sitophilus oryzae TaxID=7048 RepID=A0A6J2YVU0_SITOR|nr:peptidyl-prolyl cis-trans isomerase-like 4 isoform X2 [Sitophilus oryzae]
MSVVIETTLGDITVDLFLNSRPKACFNFLKLCKTKYYNFNLFHTISRSFIAQTGDPTGTRKGGESIFGVIDGPSKRYFEMENEPRIRHTHPGLISFVGGEDNMIGSQFFITLGEDLTYLDGHHCVFGEVVEGMNVLEDINEIICDKDDRPYKDVRITHTVILDDPYPDPEKITIPSRSPSPSAERLAGGRIAPDEDVDETLGKSAREVAELQAEREAKARATILEMIGDIPDADVAPPENVLFVCKLNPVTTDDDLEIIFSRFGKIKSCEKSCEDAYFKMDNVLIDDRRIHVDFSQSVSKIKWLGKGRGVKYLDEKSAKSGLDFSERTRESHKNNSNTKKYNKEEKHYSRREHDREYQKDSEKKRNRSSEKYSHREYSYRENKDKHKKDSRRERDEDRHYKEKSRSNKESSKSHRKDSRSHEKRKKYSSSESDSDNYRKRRHRR